MTQHQDDQLDDSRSAAEAHPAEGVSDILPTTYATPEEVEAVTELADAERAVARHGATPEQAAGVETAAHARRAEDRLDGWRANKHLAT